MLVVLVMFLIAIPAMVVFFSAASYQARHTHFLYSFYATDLPLIAEALQAVPGDAQVNYPLAEGFIVTLGRDMDKNPVEGRLESLGAITITNLEDEKSEKRTFHVLPGMQVQEGSITGMVTISKKGSLISLTGDEPPEDGCSPAIGKPFKEMNIRVATGYPQIGSVLSVQDLELIAQTYRQELTQAGLIDENKPTELLLIISAEPETKDSLLKLKHKPGNTLQEHNYDHLHCKYANTFTSQILELEQATEEDDFEHYTIELIFSAKQEQRTTLLAERTSYAAALTEAILDE